jgi:oxygen-independent coproporphyrinogen III oxidase
MDEALIRRYEDRRIPRYTSYPTAPHFTPSIGAAVYREWLGEIDPAAPVSLYLHVPFCTALCWYCGCHTKVPGHYEPIARYVDALCTEIELVAEAVPATLSVQHLHWGGGTPTIIGAAAFERVTALIERRFAVAGDAERAIEIDPRRLSGDMVRALAAGGITRASLGVQSFDPVVQRAINRVQSFDETRQAVEALRDAGILSINLDLLYGLPQQSVASCRETVARALELAPDRLAVFGYAHVPAMKPHQRRIEEAALPAPRLRQGQAETIAHSLVNAGYVPIGLDHFARPEDALARALEAGTLRRNFQGYTTDHSATLIGLGASSIGTLPRGYVQNAPQIRAYGDAVAGGRLATARGVMVTDEDRFRGEIIERLMCDLRVDLGAIAVGYGREEGTLAPKKAVLAELAGAGVVRLDGSVVTIVEDCRVLARVVAAVFEAYLDPAADRHARAL